MHIQKIVAYLSIYFYIQCIYSFYFYVLVFPFRKPTFVFIILLFFKSISNNEKANNKSKCVIFYKNLFYWNILFLSEEELQSSLAVSNTCTYLLGKKDWTLAYFKTLYTCSGVQDIIYTYFVLYGRRDFSLVLKLWNEIQNGEKSKK